jgi:hypothetical protein
MSMAIDPTFEEETTFELIETSFIALLSGMQGREDEEDLGDALHVLREVARRSVPTDYEGDKFWTDEWIAEYRERMKKGASDEMGS